MDPIWIVKLPPVLLRRLKSNWLIGKFYEKLTETTYTYMISKILLSAFDDNHCSDDLRNMYMTHKDLHLTNQHFVEWMECLNASLEEIEVESSISKLLCDKIGKLKHYIVHEHESPYYMVDDLMNDVATNHCADKSLMIERLQNIKDQL